MALRKETWYTMVRQRFWSCFHGLTNDQLEEGIAELEAKFPDGNELHFDELEMYIVAKNGSSVDEE